MSIWTKQVDRAHRATPAVKGPHRDTAAVSGSVGQPRLFPLFRGSGASEDGPPAVALAALSKISASRSGMLS